MRRGPFAPSRSARCGVGGRDRVGLLPGHRPSVPAPFTLPFAVAPVGVEQGRAGDLRDLAAAGERLTKTIAGGVPSLGFPSISVLLFLTGSQSTPRLLLPGSSRHREEAEILDAVAAASPRRSRRSIGSSPSSTPRRPTILVRRFVWANYQLVARDVVSTSSSGGGAAECAARWWLRDPGRRARAGPDGSGLASRLAATRPWRRTRPGDGGDVARARDRRRSVAAARGTRWTPDRDHAGSRTRPRNLRRGG